MAASMLKESGLPSPLLHRTPTSAPQSALNPVHLAFSCQTSPHHLDCCKLYCRSGAIRQLEAKKRSRCKCSKTSLLTNEATTVELPCLPFNPSEVFTPSASKTLHLYEARFLALLDEVLGKYNNLFAHIIVERVVGHSLGLGQEINSFAATYGCLAQVESVRQLEVGALVTIRGIGRVSIVEITQVEPFLKGKASPFQDDIPEDIKGISSMTKKLKQILADVQQLQIKLKATKFLKRSYRCRVQIFVQMQGMNSWSSKTSSSDSLQTPLEKALQWAEKGDQDSSLKLFVPRREERISFAALQPVAGASARELHKLLQERLLAMESTDTLQRLKNVSLFAEESRASIAAKVAIQSLQL
ncbi:hypothetical protein O6H91_04G085900 [Diphasiastrum complanatum]|uniref:Uncharacterized protein n=1 Tax=Diphasiastrum complanatum TaxID=34168 RepID=A0ACC2DZ14_DIPCM|nr:hypothetical protein O6H91_04G085900 [Diphasiastrum complanatum]